MALNRINADSIADGTVVASDIADGTITLAKLQSGLLPSATANSAATYANAAFASANTASASGSYANSAFAAANTASTNATNAGTYANSAFASANTATASGSYANSAFSTANTASTNATNAGTYANSAFAKANTAGTGTVTSVATGNGLQGGTITTTGTLSIAAPSFNSVGSYVLGMYLINGAANNPPSAGSNYSAGTGASQIQTVQIGQCACSLSFGPTYYNSLSGTWKWLGGTGIGGGSWKQTSLVVRVS